MDASRFLYVTIVTFFLGFIHEQGSAVCQTYAKSMVGSHKASFVSSVSLVINVFPH